MRRFPGTTGAVATTVRINRRTTRAMATGHNDRRTSKRSTPRLVMLHLLCARGRLSRGDGDSPARLECRPGGLCRGGRQERPRRALRCCRGRMPTPEPLRLAHGDPAGHGYASRRPLGAEPRLRRARRHGGAFPARGRCGRRTRPAAGEILGLSVDDIDFYNGTLHVVQQLRLSLSKAVAPPKGGKLRRPRARQGRSRPPGQEPRARRRPGARHARAPALLRVRVLDAGESIKALAEYLGHSDPGLTLEVYAHLSPSSRDRARKALGRALRPQDHEG
jgi:hypothetical protein